MKNNLPVNMLLAMLIVTSSLRGGELVPIKTTNTRGETETMWVFQDDRGWKSYRTQAKRNRFDRVDYSYPPLYGVGYFNNPVIWPVVPYCPTPPHHHHQPGHNPGHVTPPVPHSVLRR